MAKKKISNNKGGGICSGWRVFPDGTKCKGCIDCDFGKKSNKSKSKTKNKNK